MSGFTLQKTYPPWQLQVCPGTSTFWYLARAEHMLSAAQQSLITWGVSRPASCPTTPLESHTAYTTKTCIATLSIPIVH